MAKTRKGRKGQRFAFVPKRIMEGWQWGELGVDERGLLVLLYALTHPWGVFPGSERWWRQHVDVMSTERRQTVDRLATLRLLDVATGVEKDSFYLNREPIASISMRFCGFRSFVSASSNGRRGR